MSDDGTDRPDVFVSYRHRTPYATWVREVLVPRLKEDGYTVVLDVEDFVAGESLPRAMERASRARVTVAIVDETYPEGGFVDFERTLASRLVAVTRDRVEWPALLQAARVVDLVGDDDPTPVVEAVHEVVRRVFVLAAEDDTEWVDAVLMPTLDSSGVSAEHSGDLPAGSVRTDEVIRRLLRSDKVVVVLSKAYFELTGADDVVQNFEMYQKTRVTLPVIRDWDIDVPPRYSPVLLIDASKPGLWDDAVAAVCKAVGVDLREPAEPGACPYPGMLPYRRDEAAVFFGRQDEIQAVVGGLRRERFVALIGPSASGKSSLALAGVAPLVARQGLDGGAPWHVEEVRVGADPVAAVAAAQQRWRRESPDRWLLVVVDQLDELYASGIADPVAAEKAIAGLLDDPAVHVVITVRADFYDRLMSGHLWPLVDAGQVPVPPLTGDRLREAIRGPARVRNVVVAGDLVEVLAAETEGQPGLLPFLQETLVTLWGQVSHRLLTLEQYQEGERAGAAGITSAIRAVADGALRRVRNEHEGGERIVRNILVSLVQFGEGRPHTRRQVRVASLVSAAPDEATFRAVFDTLVERRLVTTGTDAAGVEVADLSHEAVIHGWPALCGWVDEDRGVETERRRLLADAVDWEVKAAAGHPEVGLLQSLDLEDARRWLAAADGDGRSVDPPIRRFVDASAAADDRRRRRRVLTLAGTFAVLVLVAAVLTGLTIRARQAENRAEQASSERLALQLRSSAAELGDERLPLRALLVRAADQLDSTEGSLAEMLATVEGSRLIADRLDPPEGVGYDALWADPALGIISAGSGDGKGTVWSLDDGVPGRVRGTFDIGRTPLAMAGRAGTGLLAVGGGDGRAEQGGFPGADGAAFLVDASADVGEARLPTRRLALDGDANDSPVSALAFAGADLLVGRWDGTILVVDPGAPDAPPRRTLAVPDPVGVPEACTVPGVRDDRKVRALAVDASGRWLAAGTNNCLVVVWDLEAATVEPAQVLTGHAAKVRALAYVPGTTTLLSSGDDRSIRRWEVGAGASAGGGTVLAAAADDQRVIALCVAPDGRSVVTAGRDHRVRRWAYDGTTLALDPHAYAGHRQTIRSLACISPESFASLGADGLVVWDLDNPPRTGQPVALGAGDVAGAVAVRPGGRSDVAVATTPEVGSSGSGALVVTRPEREQDPETIDLGAVFPYAVAYSPDGRYLAVAGDREPEPGARVGVAIVYDADDLEEVSRVEGEGISTMLAVAVRDAENFAAGSDDGTVLLRVAGENAVAELDTGLRIVSAAYLGDHLLVGDVVGTLACFDPARPGRPVGRTALGREVAGLAAGTDAVAAGTTDGVVAVFPDAGDGPCDPGEWRRHDVEVASEAVTAVSLAADDELALIGTADREVELWDIARGRQIGVLPVTGEGAADAMASSAPDATTLAVAAGPAVDVYRLDRDELHAQLCNLAHRELTQDELAAYLPDEGTRRKARCG
jgi:WD40 repeat protein